MILSRHIFKFYDVICDIHQSKLSDPTRYKMHNYILLNL